MSQGTSTLWATGHLSTLFFVAFVVVAVLLGILLSVAALALEEFSFRRHPRTSEVARLVAYTLLENVGYRQLHAFWRLRGIIDAIRRHDVAWGTMTRTGFNSDPR